MLFAPDGIVRVDAGATAPNDPADMTRLRHYLENIRTSFWFLPAVMVVVAAALAFGIARVDKSLPPGELDAVPWTYTGSAEAARQLLATVAASMISVAGVAFSITVVALTLASNQFGPRLLRNFMRDRGNQVVLGTFIATFVYCLLVLRTVRGQDGAAFVPHLGVTIAVVLALAGLGVLIYFIHHAAVSMQAPVIIAAVSRELHASIDRLFPDPIGEDGADEPAADAPEPPRDFERDAIVVRADRDGYLQLINDQQIMKVARERDLLVRLERRPGHFVAQGDPLARIWPPTRERDAADAVRATVVVGPQQTPAQDVEFSIRQLVEIAVRALSPGINDPFTAINCVDHLGAALRHVAARRMPSPWRYDESGNLRIIAPTFTFAEITDTALRQVRQNSRRSAATLIRMLEAIRSVFPCVHRPGDRDALLRQAHLILEAAADLPQSADRADAESRYREILTAGATPTRRQRAGREFTCTLADQSEPGA